MKRILPKFEKYAADNLASSLKVPSNVVSKVTPPFVDIASITDNIQTTITKNSGLIIVDYSNGDENGFDGYYKIPQGATLPFVHS